MRSETSRHLYQRDPDHDRSKERSVTIVKDDVDFVLGSGLIDAVSAENLVDIDDEEVLSDGVQTELDSFHTRLYRFVHTKDAAQYQVFVEVFANMLRFEEFPFTFVDTHFPEVDTEAFSLLKKRADSGDISKTYDRLVLLELAELVFAVSYEDRKEDDIFPPSVAVEFAKQYENYFKKQVDVFMKDRLPAIQKKSVDFLKDKAARGILPITVGEVESRLDGIIISFVDSMYGHEESVKGEWHSGEREVILVFNPTMSDDELIDTFIHECMHGLSGNSHVEGAITNISHTEARIFFSDDKTHIWLEEALTEQILWEETDPSEHQSYKDECRLLQFLYSIGLDRDFAYEAYMEQWQTQISDVERDPLQKTKAFLNDIDRVFGTIRISANEQVSCFDALNRYLDYGGKKDDFSEKVDTICACDSLLDLQRILQAYIRKNN